MRIKQLAASVLALVLMLALAACAKQDGGQSGGGQKPASGVEGDFTPRVKEIEQAYNKPDVTPLEAETAAYGAEIAAARVDAEQAVMDSSDLSYSSDPRLNTLQLADWQPGSAVTLTVTEATKLDDDQLRFYREQAETAVGSLQALALFQQPQDGVSEDAAAQFTSYIEKSVACAEVLSGCEITDGYALTITADVDGAEQTVDTAVLLVNGAWILGSYFELVG